MSVNSKQLTLFDLLEDNDIPQIQYAINLWDCQRRADPTIWQLIRDAAPSRYEFFAGEHWVDGLAVLLECDAEQAQTIVHIIRLHYPKHKLRCYTSQSGKSWKRV